MPGTYVTDLRHYLDNDGEIVTEMPPEARQMAGFLALIVDEVSGSSSSKATELTLRCRTESCEGQIQGLVDGSEEIYWHCPSCDATGVIRNWKDTKWDQSS